MKNTFQLPKAIWDCWRSSHSKPGVIAKRQQARLADLVRSLRERQVQNGDGTVRSSFYTSFLKEEVMFSSILGFIAGNWYPAYLYS